MQRINNAGLTRFDWVIFFLSVYVVGELYADLVWEYPASLLFDFFNRLRKADRRWVFVRGNWLDFVSSIPMVGVLRVARVGRIVRILRLVRSGRAFYSFFDRHHAFSTFQTVVALTFLIVLMAGAAMMHLEGHVNGGFRTFGDSVWWSAIATLTLGFAQGVEPVSPEGRFVAIVLIGAGIALIGTFTGMVADFFIGDEELLERVDKLEQRLARIEEKLDRAIARDEE